MLDSLPELPVWVYLHREGQMWIVQVLDLDLVTQGETLEEALEMAVDATLTVVADAVVNNQSSFRRPAPKEDWDRLWSLFETGPARQLPEVISNERQYSAIGTQLRVRYEQFEQFVKDNGIELSSSLLKPPNRLQRVTPPQMPAAVRLCA